MPEKASPSQMRRRIGRRANTLAGKLHDLAMMLSEIGENRYVSALEEAANDCLNVSESIRG